MPSVTIHCRTVTFPAIAAILFDKDGTLARSETLLRNLAQRRSRLLDAQFPGLQEPLLMAFGIHQNAIDPAGLMAVGSRRENEIAAAAYIAETGRGWIEALDIARAAFVESDRQFSPKSAYTPPLEGALHLVQTLSQAGVKLGILSSDVSEHIQDFSQRYGLAPFLHLQLGADGPFPKPDPRLLSHACDRLEVSPGATLIVGDSLADLQLANAGRAAGFVGMRGGWQIAPTLRGASVLVDRLDEIELLPQA